MNGSVSQSEKPGFFYLLNTLLGGEGSSSADQYGIPKPVLPLWTRCSVGIIFGGVIALGVIAFITFRLFNLPVIPAALLAGVIEYSTFTAGVNLIRGNKLTLIEIVIGLIGSGVVNYVHFNAMNAEAVTKVTSPILIGILAVFPLLVIFSSSLWVGKEIAEHGMKVKTWEMDRNQWVKDQAAKAESAQVEAVRREQEARHQREEADRQTHEREMEAARKEREHLAEIEAANRKQVELARIAQEDRQAARQARLEGKKLKLEAATKSAPASNPLPVFSTPSGESSIEPSRGTYEDFHALLLGNGHHEWKNAELADRFHVSVRTITTWRARFQEEHPLPVAHEVN